MRELNDMAKRRIKMKFYEFNKFEYYALIGAKSEQEAKNYYVEIVADIEGDEKLDKITKKEAEKKLLNICETEEEKTKARKEFNECILQDEPYLVLVDRSLL